MILTKTTFKMQNYIVYMGDKVENTLFGSRLQEDLIGSVLGINGESTVRYTFSRSFSGFVVHMTEQEKNAMTSM